MSYDIDGRPKKERFERRKAINLLPPPPPPPSPSTGGTLEESASRSGWDTLDIRTLENRKRKKRPGEPDDETLDELSNYLGYRPQGVTITDERTIYSDSNGARY